MPLYTFYCQTCDIHLERLCPPDKQEPQRCSTCGGTLRRVYHPSQIMLKGSGFHSTDYGRFGPRSRSKR
ncbi:FmdB family zinc ribbon protein [Candidatus Neomarinimicrobiota bacterium]